MDCLDGIGQSAFTPAMQSEANEHYDEAVAYYLENIMPADELDELFAKACVEIRTFLTEHLKGKCDTDERKFHYGMLTRLLLSILIDADRYDSTCFDTAFRPCILSSSLIGLLCCSALMIFAGANSILPAILAAPPYRALEQRYNTHQPCAVSKRLLRRKHYGRAQAAQPYRFRADI